MTRLSKQAPDGEFLPKRSDLGQKRVRKVTSEERQQESVGAGRKGQEREGGRGPGQGKVAEGLPVVTYGCRLGQKQGAGALVGAMGAVAPWEEREPLARETTPRSFQKLPLPSDAQTSLRKWLNLQRPDNNRLCLIQMDTFAILEL